MMDGDEIAALLQDIPCSFSLSATVAKKSKSALEAIIAKLLKEDDMRIYDMEEEIIRDYNLLSYLYWCTGNTKDAFEFNKKVLERNPNNITAAVNKIWFYLELHSPYEAKTALEHFHTLKKSRKFDSICLTGEAETAYAYTRLGVRHYETAVDEFNKVLSKATKRQDVDKNSVYLWKSGLGLTLRRLSHTGNVGNVSEMQKTRQRLREAVDIFVELIESDWQSKRNIAFSYVQLAQVAETDEWDKLTLDEFPIKYRGWDIETFYHMAERHCKGDTYTLERYGKFLRLKHKLDEAETKLRASIAVMPTSTAHHYLALVLKAKLNKDLNKTRPFSRSYTQSRTTEFQRYTRHDYGQPRFDFYANKDTRTDDFYANKDTRTESPFQGERTGRRGQKQRYPRYQQPYTSGLSKQCTAFSGIYKGYSATGETSSHTYEEKMEASSRHEFVDNKANTASMRSKVKCPTKVLPYPKGDARVDEIIYHLNQAIKLGENRAATYDKGLILRATRDFDGAIATFQSLIKEETSLMYLANAYEQCAFCVQSKLEDTSIDPETEKRLLHERKSYLIASVAISTKMVARIPNISKIWKAGTSLKNILIGEGKSKETLKELALLSERLNDYKDAVAYYQEILQLGESQQENPEILMKIVKNQIADGQFIEAVSVFDLIMMMPNGKRCFDEKLYCTALIEAEFESIRGTAESNTDYLKSVLNYKPDRCEAEGDSKEERGRGKSPSYQSSTETGEETFDIFVLCSENGKTLQHAKRMVTFLQAKCKVTATLNREDVVPGHLELSTMLAFISQSQNVVICLDEEDALHGMLQRGIEHAAREKSNIVVVLMTANASIPSCLGGFQSILYKTSEEVSEEDWMKSLFYKLAGC